jgi:hypothetical protein
MTNRGCQAVVERPLLATEKQVLLNKACGLVCQQRVVDGVSGCLGHVVQRIHDWCLGKNGCWPPKPPIDSSRFTARRRLHHRPRENAQKPWKPWKQPAKAVL